MAEQFIAPGTGQLDFVLSNFAKGFRNNADPTDLLFPRLPVSEQSASYFVYGREMFRAPVQTLRAPGDRAAQTRGWSLSRAQYYCSSRALEGFIPNERQQAYKLGDLTQETAQFNQDQILFDRQIRAAALVSNPANYPSANTLALSTQNQWDNAGADPVVQVEIYAKPQIMLAGVAPNTLFVSYDVAQALKTNPNLIKRFSGVTAIGSVNEQQLATMFGVDRIVVMASVIDTDAGSGFLWKNMALLTYVDPTTAGQPATLLGPEGGILPRTITFGKSFTWVNAPNTVGGYSVIVQPHPFASAKSTIVANDWYSDERITGAEVGFLFTNVLSKYNS